ncbi:MAG: peptide chain release factor 1 [bacterium]
MEITPAIRKKLESMENRHRELERQLADGSGRSREKLKELGREYAGLGRGVSLFRELKGVEQEIGKCGEMLAEDEEMREMCKEELEKLRPQLEEITEKILSTLAGSDEPEDQNFIMEIRAGAGGNEAALFTGDLYRMYARYAESKKWKVENLGSHPTDLGGFKEVSFAVSGKGAFRMLRQESGVHRVQRVPVTEAGGRIHTSTSTVAVLLEPDEVEVEISPSDLKVDTYRASSAGGQHVNKTDSAVRITHLPSGLVVECQDERSQHQNRAKAMRLLRARLLQKMQEEQQKQIASERRSQVGTGDRSERIRTYNFPQGRVSDHRISLTIYILERIIEGEMDELLAPLQAAMRAKKLEELSEE